MKNASHIDLRAIVLKTQTHRSSDVSYPVRHPLFRVLQRTKDKGPISLT